MGHSLNLVVDELARQVKRHRDKRRKRREAHAAGDPVLQLGSRRACRTAALRSAVPNR